MRRSAGGLALLAIWIVAAPGQALAAVLPPSLAQLEPSAPPMRFSLEGSNGHRVSVEGGGTRVTLTVENEDGLAIYSARGKARDGVLRAGFGDLGRIAVRFEQSGKASRREPPNGCSGKPAVTRSGAFLGTIRFRGEGGYTRVGTNRARGSATSSPRWRCKGDGDGPGDAPEGAVDEALNAPVLASFTPGSQTVFVAIGEDGPEAAGFALLLAATKEQRGRVKVERVAFVIGKAGSFEVDPGLTSATVTPPEPFSGSASFQRNPDGTVSWSGSLTVSLPGAPGLALTGPTFTTDLAKPKTTGELFALLGQPGLAGL